MARSFGDAVDGNEIELISFGFWTAVPGVLSLTRLSLDRDLLPRPRKIESGRLSVFFLPLPDDDIV